MSDNATTVLVRAVLDEDCAHVAVSETGIRARVASKILETAARGDTSVDRLRWGGRRALTDAPTMWR
ncbi:hypothetical protein [Bradyrhizobium sp. CCBAU 53338]|uniref:hypothetical protein n=1 Tax=Bradyrhizobium sp. CCBAU 53338 TaxID=1325111 RepID=UPI00188D2FB6|nr:hypothetical protein [Bradyrhizobium sp. CCBAU 53338]QOZ51531.1 hypothetical protein XH90_09170 [Bradyrhizobium sp. CCBAU 53338]